MSSQENVRVIHRGDYAPPPFWVDDVELEFDLDPHDTVVTARLSLRRNTASLEQPLVLDGEQLELRSIAVDGRLLSSDDYDRNDQSLVIKTLPDHCQLETQVVIQPAANTSLYGLYQSSGNFCTQCEALGFRRITYFPDRPDVMAKYRVTIRGDQGTLPVLLSNGNRVASRELADGRHEAVWEDPFPKPSYLFALVAGNLQCKRGNFTTGSGREVALEIWVEPQNIDRCDHALASLQKAMRWDEETFGLEYDLDIYMVVAVNDFNMGAMENKGLNIFNSKFVLASPDTATDDDYERIEAVMAHEYFHNWTGNRVTCRDWFQLTLKEGLTVFRDQQFTADQTSAAVKRIDDVALLRARQFVEDSGPMAHPIRPESYISMDNFYTTTVYEKGAEVVRMYHTLLGVEGFRRGIDLYFQRHDGSAVTCDDFRAAMADANGADLSRFARWYAQPGTPRLEVSGQWDADRQRYTLHCQQSYPPLPHHEGTEDVHQPVPLPIAVGMLDAQGKDQPFCVESHAASLPATTQTLLLEEAEARFTLSGLHEEPIPSVLRGFSAPVRMRIDRSAEHLAFQMAYDSDPFNRWDAGQTLATRCLLDLIHAIQQQKPLVCPDVLSEAFGKILADRQVDEAFKALALRLPSESVLGEEMEVVDPDAIHAAREFLKRALAERHQQALHDLYRASSDAHHATDQQAVRRRRLKNTMLAYLASLRTDAATALVVEQWKKAKNMTDAQSAIGLLAHLDCPEREAALATFYQRWRDNPLVLDKWFTVQAMAQREDTVVRVGELTGHADFVISNPNRVRALLGAFSQNPWPFHRPDGGGYRLVADFVIAIDSNNPQLAARLVTPFNRFSRFDDNRRQRMKAELERIIAKPRLSKDVYEIVERALHG